MQSDGVPGLDEAKGHPAAEPGDRMGVDASAVDIPDVWNFGQDDDGDSDDEVLASKRARAS